MGKLKALLLTEGMHGMISQVEGLAKALNLEFIHEKIELNNFWKFLPPKITPVKNFVFKNKIENAIGKIPFSDNMLVGSNKIGLKLGGKTYNSSFTVNKDGNASLNLSKSFTKDLQTELSADKDKVKVGLNFKF